VGSGFCSGGQHVGCCLLAHLRHLAMSVIRSLLEAKQTSVVLDDVGCFGSQLIRLSHPSHSPSLRSGEALRASSGFHRNLIGFRSATTD
jgi:hypothetical protein